MARVDRAQRRKDMIAALRALARERGPDVSLMTFCQEAGYCSMEIYRCFENWGGLRERAGLPRHRDYGRAFARHTRESLIAVIVELAGKRGPGVSLHEFSHHTGISRGPVYRLFGSWRNFKEAAGLHDHGKPGCPPRHDRASMLALMKEMFAEHGRSLTLADFCRQTGLSRWTVLACGGWSQLRLELGLSKRGRRRLVDPHNPLNGIIDDLFEEPIIDPLNDVPPDVLKKIRNPGAVFRYPAGATAPRGSAEEGL